MKKAKFAGLFIVFTAAFSIFFTACRGNDARAVNFTPGTFTVSYGEAGTPGWRTGPLVIDVTFSKNRIASIEVMEHGESMYGSGWWWRAFPLVSDQILHRQSTMNIDAVSGATASRNAIINAVNEAIVMAGANPADLRPQISGKPAQGDLFAPGFHIITVPAASMDIDGNQLSDDTPTERIMLYSPDVNMTLRVSVSRNSFFVHEGGAFGLGQGALGHGEGAYPNEISGDTWGGRWFSQPTTMLINNSQATRNIDISRGAKRSAAAVIWGVEQALIAAGGDPASLTPRETPYFEWMKNPSNPEAAIFVPGHYTVTVPGDGGDITLTVTLDRFNIRRITIDDHNESEAALNKVWPSLRDNIYRTQNLNEVALIRDAPELSKAIVEGLRKALSLAAQI